MRKLIIALLFLPSIGLAQIGPVRWRVDANISGANPSLGTSAVTSYTGILDGSLTLTNNTGTGTQVITSQIPCSTTVASSGTTCSSGTESIGVAFTPPGNWKGDLRACVSFTHLSGNFDGLAASTLRTGFQIVQTPNNAQTISAEGKTRVNSGKVGTNSSSIFGTSYFPHQLCGIFTIAAAGQVTLRLFYEQSVAGTITSSNIVADANANNGQPDIHWEVYPLNN